MPVTLGWRALGLPPYWASDNSRGFPVRVEGVTLHKLGLREYAFEIKLGLFQLD